MLFGCCISPKDYEMVEAAGFDFVEFPGAEIAAMTDEEFARVCDTVQAGKIPCLSLNSYCKEVPAMVGDRFDAEKARVYAEHLCSRAETLGVRMIGVGAPKARRLPPDYDQDLADAQCRAFLKVTAEVAKRHGVQINFEALNPHVCEYGTSTKHAAELVSDIGLDNLALVVDFYHRQLAGESICDFSGFESLIRHTHISTCGPQRQRSFPGMEELAYYAEILAGLKAASYNGTMSIEAPAEDLLWQGAATLEMLRLADTGGGSLLVGCVADDFTGGSDAASFLRKAGLRTVLLNGIGSCEGLEALRPEAIVIALKSRSIAAESAVAQTCGAARWLLARGARHLYFKYCSTFDSTPRGNIGPVTDALLELTGSRYTVLCPSLPVNGRTVRDGILYVNGVPLAESPMRHHPINPMTKSDLSQLMEEQSRYPCVVLQETQMRAEDPVGGCSSEGCFTVVPPYATDADGRQIAARFGHLPLLTGGSGLLEHLGRRYKAEQAVVEQAPLEDAPEAKETMPRLLLAGSCSAMTQKQVQRYLDQGGDAVRIEPDRLLSGAQTEEKLQQAIAAAQGDILLYSTTDPEQVKRYQAAGAEQISALLEGLMGRLAVYGKEHGFRRIVVAGGETSGAVTQALHAKAYRIGKEAAPGVPELWPIDQPALGLVLKSGNFGDERFFLTALKD